MQFITTGLDAELLTDAIKHLPNLETIGMRDFHSRSRNRDNSAWASYGCPTFSKEAGPLVVPTIGIISRQDRGSEYTSHVFLTILRAIGNAALCGASPNVTRIEVLLHTCEFPDYSFKIPDRFDAAISLALSKLKAILLDGLVGEIDSSYLVVKGDDGNGIPGWGYFLSRFLARASSLEHLRLNFQKYDQSATEKVLSWLAGAKVNFIESSTSANASGDLPAHFPPAPKFPKLQNIDIGMATVTERVLLALYKNYISTLRGISLHKVTLEGKSDGTINLWAQLCNKLAKAGLDIRMLWLSFIWQKSRDPERRGQVTFKGSKNSDAKGWRGTTFSQSIKDITGEMQSSWEDVDSDDIDDDDDDDEEEYSDDEF
ncbi:hypothetical protein O1611_g2428 [Lasiodiplodia mahajangana]|uniref:Uncharacterized protein n=1 Tax=Lasiodiplodia mahajangana TaxID=1108764 RepID=A0ACC2JUW9_9PEZI|nr:hypothetical protein O1611_g2428 [Lasiodiplodia mahajangana]